MPELCVAFWNVCNLFEAGVVCRGPADQAAYEQRVAQVARVVSSLHPGQPDLVALCEVGSARVAADVAAQVGLPTFSYHFEPATAADATGLMLLWKPLRVTLDTMTLLDGGRRPFAASARFELNASGSRPFHLVVNHWKSDLPTPGGPAPSVRREETARLVRTHLEQLPLDESALLLGDFNAEPWAPELGRSGLRASRRHSQARAYNGRIGGLYNSGWRFAGAPEPWEASRAQGYAASRPQCSYAGKKGSPRLLLDQMIVSSGALRGPTLSLREAEVRYHCSGDTARRDGRGHWLPAAACSDHLPLVARFDTC